MKTQKKGLKNVPTKEICIQKSIDGTVKKKKKRYRPQVAAKKNYFKHKPQYKRNLFRNQHRNIAKDEK